MFVSNDRKKEEYIRTSEQLTIQPGNSLHGEVGAGCKLPLPGDKSLSHRAALLAAMADGFSQVENFLVSGVTQAMLDALTAFGVKWNLAGTTLVVDGIGLKPRPGLQTVYLQCGNSATTLRLLTGALAAWNWPAFLDGSSGLRRRPMQRIIEPLRQMGVEISSEEGRAPLTIISSPRPLRGIHSILPVASAQVKSCLLLAALVADGATTLVEPGPSRDHTERMLQAMGVHVYSEKQTREGLFYTRLEPPRPLTLMPLNQALPCDMSAAAFLMVAALITPGSQLILRGVGLNPTRTGLLESLLEMGASIEIISQSEQGGEPVGDLIVQYSDLTSARVSGERVVRMIDEFPIFAIAAAYAQGTTIVTDAGELRYKESNRISDLGKELEQLGVDFEETTDGFLIQGGKPLRGGLVNSHGDHRLAMALAIAGLAAQSPVSVCGAEIIQESFPGFASVLRDLGVKITLNEVNNGSEKLS